MRVLLRDLTPGTTYLVQARTTDGVNYSQWSQLFSIPVTSDTLAPAPVVNLSWTSVGTSFIATWTMPTVNSDGSPLSDLQDFVVKVSSGASSATYTTTAGRFDFPIEVNRAAFGTAKASVTISIQARDQTGNLSTAISATATNPPPAAPTGVTAVGGQDRITVSWTPNTDADLAYYEVHMSTVSGFTPGSGTKVWQGNSTNNVINVTSYSPQYVKVLAYDTMGSSTASAEVGPVQAQTAAVVDTTAPAAPNSLTASSVVDSTDPSGGSVNVTLTWTKTPIESDLSGFRIGYKKSSDSAWSYIDVGDRAATSALIARLLPNTAYHFKIAAYDYSQNYSADTNASVYPYTTAKDTTAPAQVTGISATPGLTTATVLWSEVADADVINANGYYEIQLDTANTFNTANLITKRTAGSIISFAGLTTGTAYYTRVRAIDASGNIGTWSATVSVTPNALSNNDIVAATIGGDKIIANSLDANTLKANSTFSQNLSVGAVFTMATGGIMQSANYLAGSAGWRLTNNSLEINGGTITAKALQLQDSANLIPAQYADFEWASSWYNSSTIYLGANCTVSVGNPAVSMINSQAAYFVNNDAAVQQCLLGTSASDFNVTVEPSTTYIYSMYVFTNTSTVILTYRSGGGTTVIATITGVATGAWARISGSFTTGSSTSKIIMGVELQPSQTCWIDGVQVERQTGGLTTPSAWKRPGNTSIVGDSIRTGTIQSTSTIIVGSLTQPSWSINLGGNAQFNDVLVRGKLVVGQSSDTSSNQAAMSVQSWNYNAGSTGWAIKGDGSVEFQNAVVRGTINATSGSFSGNISSTATISGGSLVGASISTPNRTADSSDIPGRVVLDSNGLWIWTKGTTNLVQNPSFEKDQSDVVASGNSSIAYSSGITVVGTADPSVKYGRYALLVQSTGTNGTSTPGYAQVRSVAAQLQPSTTYTLSFYAAQNTTGSNTYVNTNSVQVIEAQGGARTLSTGLSKYSDEYLGDGQVVTNGIGHGLFPANWSRRFYVTFTTPSDFAANGSVYINLPAPCDVNGFTDTAQSIWYDGLQLEAHSYPTRYCDGDQPFSSWDGTVNNSTSHRVDAYSAAFSHTLDGKITGSPVLTNAVIQNTFRLGSGAPHGTNYFNVFKTVAVAYPSASSYQDFAFDVTTTASRNAQDDGLLYQVVSAASEFMTPVAGIYTLCVSITWPANTSGRRGVRFITAGGSVLAVQQDTATGPSSTGAFTQTLNYTGFFPANPTYYVKVQVYQDSGANLTIPANGGTSPVSATWAYVC